MNITVAAPAEALPALVDRAARALGSARSAAEVLEARELAGFAYDAAKRAARMARAKDAHDSLVAAAHRAQADALLIESQAKRRLADEYDAAQERGEVAGQGKPSKAEGYATTADIGLTHKAIHEARQFRDAEAISPGLAERALNEVLARGEEPTKAELRRVVLDTIQHGYRAPRSPSAPRHVGEKDPAYDAFLTVDGSCEDILEILSRVPPHRILNGALDDDMRARSVATITRARDALNAILEAEDA